MKLKLFVFFALIFIPVSSACVVEIRSTTFYVNGTQEVTRDWFVIDFENTYGYDLFDVRFGELAFVPVIRDGERVRIDPYKNVSPKHFPIAVFATVESFGDRSIVRYVLENSGDSVDVSISIPMFPDFISCDNCVVSNERIVFNRTIARNESMGFNLTLRRDFTIPDGTISFSYGGKIDMSFAANVPVVVEKGRSENWIGVFKVSNILDKKVEGNATAFVEFATGNRTMLFEEEIELEPGENFTKSVEVKSQLVPTFFFRVQLRVEDYCNLTTLPATEIGGRYVIGYATLKGFTHTTSAAVPVMPALPTPEIVTVPTPEIPPSPEIVRETIETVPEILLPPPKVAKELVVQYVVMMIPAIFGTFFTTLFIPLRSRGIVALKEHERFLVALYPKFRIFTTPSNPVRGGIVIEPDEELVSRFLGMGIDRKYAELLAVAVKVKKPVIALDASVARVAVAFGILVIMYGRA
ncbi:MAG: hypothetical protein QW763_02560 [Archaeoglobaceae archaeon]